MRPEDLQALLTSVADGSRTVQEATEALSTLPFEDLGYARVDHHRQLRTGVPEVVFGQGKTPQQIAGVLAAIRAKKQPAIVTRVRPEVAEAALLELASLGIHDVRYEPTPRLLTTERQLEGRGRGRIAVVSAGTSDLPVAEEAARTAELLGHEVLRQVDVGVAGLHRLLPSRDALEACEVVIVVAGMEGALPSVVKGLISRPVIAVPTSVGFGVSFGGVTALLGMLSSCAAGVTVVNIDNGFGAGYAAAVINARREP